MAKEEQTNQQVAEQAEPEKSSLLIPLLWIVGPIVVVAIAAIWWN